MADQAVGVTVAFNAAGEVRLEFASALNAMTVRSLGKGIRVQQQPRMSGPLIETARNEQVRTFLAGDHDWLLMIDADMSFHPDTIIRLLELADPVERPIVGGLTWGVGAEGLFPTIYHWADVGYRRAEGWDQNTGVEVDGTGAACLMVHRSVFEKMAGAYPEPYPWFQNGFVENSLRPMGEDLTFCYRARELGFPIWVHTGVQFGHMKTFEINQQFYLDWCRTHRMIVTGTGRCGTAYVALALQRNLVPADHERFFNPETFGIPPWGRADVSWLAAPFLSHYQDAFVVHLVRDPLKTVASLVGIGLFEEPDSEFWNEGHAPYQEFARKMVPAVFEASTPLGRAVSFYLAWNEMIEPHANIRLRVEDQITGESLWPAVAAAGSKATPFEIQRKIDEVPPFVNARPRGDINWDDIPEGKEKRKLEAMADQYGYPSL